MTAAKAHLAGSICMRLGFPRRHSYHFVESLLEFIKSTLQEGKEILTSGPGKFH